MYHVSMYTHIALEYKCVYICILALEDNVFISKSGKKMFYHMDACKIMLILKICIFAHLPSLYHQTIFYFVILECFAAS